MSQEIKILMTDSYGAGWSTWADRDNVGDFMLTYQPIIDYIEAKDAKDEDHDLHDKHPLVLQMLEEIKTRFGDKAYACVLSADNLRVETCYRPSLVEQLGIKCYDGKEYIG